MTGLHARAVDRASQRLIVNSASSILLDGCHTISSMVRGAHDLASVMFDIAG